MDQSSGLALSDQRCVIRVGVKGGMMRGMKEKLHQQKVVFSSLWPGESIEPG